jgi:hypothetical protein
VDKNRPADKNQKKNESKAKKTPTKKSKTKGETTTTTTDNNETNTSKDNDNRSSENINNNSNSSSSSTTSDATNVTDPFAEIKPILEQNPKWQVSESYPLKGHFVHSTLSTQTSTRDSVHPLVANIIASY